jgi:hypothetical protein
MDTLRQLLFKRGYANKEDEYLTLEEIFNKIDTKDEYFYQDLCQYCVRKEDGFDPILVSFLHQNIDLYAYSDYILRDVCSMLDLDWIQFFLDLGCDVNKIYPGNKTLLTILGQSYTFVGSRSLVLSQKEAHIQAVKLLLQHGADPTLLNSKILNNMIDDGYEELIEILVDKGCNPNIILMKAATNNENIFFHLLRLGANLSEGIKHSFIMSFIPNFQLAREYIFDYYVIFMLSKDNDKIMNYFIEQGYIPPDYIFKSYVHSGCVNTVHTWIKNGLVDPDMENGILIANLIKMEKKSEKMKEMLKLLLDHSALDWTEKK